MSTNVGHFTLESACQDRLHKTGGEGGETGNVINLVEDIKSVTLR